MRLCRSLAGLSDWQAASIGSSQKTKERRHKDSENAQVDPGVRGNAVDARRAHSSRNDCAQSDIERDNAQGIAAGKPHQFRFVPVRLFDKVCQGNRNERKNAGSDEGQQPRAEGGEEKEGKRGT